MEPALLKSRLQRVSARAPIDASILCQPLTSFGGKVAVHGVMRNVSSHGLYFETAKRFEPGAILLVRTVSIDNPPQGMTTRQPRTICLAEVKWLQEIAGDRGVRYGMGARYLD